MCIMSQRVLGNPYRLCSLTRSDLNSHNAKSSHVCFPSGISISSFAVHEVERDAAITALALFRKRRGSFSPNIKSDHLDFALSRVTRNAAILGTFESAAFFSLLGKEDRSFIGASY